MSGECDNRWREQLRVRNLGLVDYCQAWQAMQQFTAQRQPDTLDELWLLEHPRVFTQGQAGRAEHLLHTGDIPVVPVDRGGQVTYHGPGQLVLYLLVDLRRRKLGVREFVTRIEQSIVALLDDCGIAAHAREDAPGVYVEGGAKIAQIGLRVRRGCSFHGLSLNVDMDMEPFGRINPCGYAGMAVTNMALQGGVSPGIETLGQQLVAQLMSRLGYNAKLSSAQLPLINGQVNN